jgi:hypothetical protein
MQSQKAEIFNLFYLPRFKNALASVTAMQSSSDARATGRSRGCAGGVVGPRVGRYERASNSIRNRV